ncbi:major facilitator superfamily domain-containing protein [Poronia punctata]|nr:major facilitator superfamily domain-containing protein [Poronia punctata]
MAWGILEDRRMPHVPGTVLLADTTDIPTEYRSVARELLKHGRGRNSHVILAPQPSDSPNDPLNWPTWRKDFILTIVGLSAAVVGAYGPMLSPGFVEVAAQLNISVNTLSEATAWVVLLIGLSLFLLNPIAKKIGRRPVYVLSSIIMLTGSIWGAVSRDYGSFLASRIYSGVGMAPYEVLVQCTIADMYFVHERATRIAIWNMFLYAVSDQGWKWTFIWCAILFGILLPFVIFFVPETAFRRRASYEERLRATKEERTRRRFSEKSSSVEHKEGSSAVFEPSLQIEAKETFWKSLRFYSGVYTETPLWKIFLRPLVVFWYPAVLWAFLVYGVTFTWIVVFSVVNAPIFTAEPYNFSVSQTGLISLSPFLLSFMGEIVSGPMNDWICLWLAKKNRGVYEPEFRLPPIIISFLIVHYQTHWTGPVLCFGLANMSLAFSNASVFGYVIDAHKGLSEEAFVAINARNLLTFGLTYFVNDWRDRAGVLAVFNVLGIIFVIVNALTVLLWFFGKRI